MPEPPPPPAEAKEFDFQLGALAKDAPFQGTMKLQIVVDPQNSTTGPMLATFAVRGKKARWNLFSPENRPGSDAYRIYDADIRRFYTVVPQQKTVFMVDESVLTADAGAPRKYTFTPKALEPKGTVQDFPCDRVEAQDDEVHYNVCLARGLVPLPFQLLAPGASALLPFGAQLEDEGLFPLADTAHKIKGGGPNHVGQIIGSLIVLDLKRGSVPDQAFTWPDFYVRVPGTTLDLHPSLR